MLLPSESGKRGDEMVETPRKPVTLAEKLDRLFKTVHPHGEREYTHEEVAEGIRQQGGPTISATYIWQLRRGIKDNPTKRHLEALAEFFMVSPAYFFDEAAANLIHSQLALLAAMRDAQVRHIATRVAELSPEGIDAVTAIIEQIRRLQGLSDVGDRGEGAADATSQERDR